MGGRKLSSSHAKMPSPLRSRRLRALVLDPIDELGEEVRLHTFPEALVPGMSHWFRPMLTIEEARLGIGL